MGIKTHKMDFKDTFCSSPWFHARITEDGNYNFCTWQKTKDEKLHNISDITPIDYFQNKMEKIRKSMVAGEVIDECSECYEMEKYNKISGRQRQLLKTGIELDNFDKTLQASPFYDEFKKTADGGKCKLLPIAWHINMGNFCNSACVYCTPAHSSTMATEFIKMNLIDKSQKPPQAWCRDSILLKKFTDTLLQTKNLKFIHFISGETMITPTFMHVLRILNENNMHGISIGFVTNLTVWDEELNNILSKFKEVNVGFTVETFDEINDYIRYPSKIENVREILSKWIALGKKNKWLLKMRLSPTWMTVDSIDTVFEYAYNNGIGIECGLMSKSTSMRINALPQPLLAQVISQFERWISSKDEIDKSANQLEVIGVAHHYLNYMKRAKYEPKLLHGIITFIKKLEQRRNNSIINYKPHYEEFLRLAGY